MSRPSRRLPPVALLLLLALSAPGAAQQQPHQPQPAPPQVPVPGEPQADDPEQEQPVFRVGINFVQVDVIVTDRQGNLITDLQPSEVEVLENSRPQVIETFRYVEVGAVDPDDPAPAEIRSLDQEQRELARDDVRLFVIFLDDYHVRLGASMRVREPLIRFIQNYLSPSDMIAVMYPLTPISDLRFTRNHQAIVSAIETFEGRKFNYQPRNHFEERYAYYPAAVVERVRNEVAMTALKGLVTHLGGLREGRKSVIFVSEGFTAMLPPQLQDPIAAMPGLGNPLRGQPGAGDSPFAERAEFFSAVDINNDLREVYGAANRSNTAIYAVDPRGLAGFEYDVNEGVGMQTDRRALESSLDTLRVLAANTDGRAIVNQNDIEAGLRQIISDSSAYYLLGYSSTEAPSDGRFHEIRVRVNRPGVQVRARRGYWALTEEETRRALAPTPAGPPPAVAEALAGIVEPPRGRTVRTWIGAGRSDDGSTRVTFVWEPVPPVPGQPTGHRAPARVSLTAASEDGPAYFRGRVPDVDGDDGVASTSGSSSSGASAGSFEPMRATFEAAPGLMQLRVAVEDEHGQVLDSDTQVVSVPDFTAPQVALGTPAVYRARTAVEMRAIREDPAMVPTASRDFHRTDRLLMRVEAYGPGGTVPAVAARLLNRQGDAMSELPVQRRGSAYEIDLPLAALAAGEYLVSFEAAGPDGEDDTVQELVAFRLSR